MRRLLASALLLLPGWAAAQADPDTLRLPFGRPVEEVVAGSDPAQRYALYLPSGYAAGAPAPVLFLMDPRGRALVPLRLFQAAAERHGFVVLSSYGTLSDVDSAFAANGRALTAMLVDAQARFSVDPARMYLVGFSGTAHYAWAVAPQLDGHLAGIVGVGSGLPPDVDWVRLALGMARPFAYFGAAGTTDFNYDPAYTLDLALDDTPFPHRFATFPGQHAWPPEAVARAAVEWLRLHAMRAGLAPPDPAWTDSLRAAHLAEAAALAQAGALADAARRYREVAADFRDAAPEAAARADALTRDPAAARALDRRAALSRRVLAYAQEAGDFFRAYGGGDPPTHEQALRRLEVASLRAQAAGSSDAEAAAAAERMLAVAFAHAASFQPQAYFARGDYARAAGVLRLALAIRPEAAWPCHRLARAEAQRNRADAALEALDCALRGGVAAAALAADPLLAPLHADPRFQALVGPR